MSDNCQFMNIIRKVFTLKLNKTEEDCRSHSHVITVPWTITHAITVGKPLRVNSVQVWFPGCCPVNAVQHVGGIEQIVGDRRPDPFLVGIKVEVLRDLLPFPSIVQGKGDEKGFQLKDETTNTENVLFTKYSYIL